uniref:Farnesyl pyrophosphate synthase 1-like isoform X3 n=1 Tax=Rhizophora mucronata TaxID=61149 RepID=A0A2P2LK33_RHIMU
MSKRLLLSSYSCIMLEGTCSVLTYCCILIILYAQVACALLMAGENLDNHAEMKRILIEIGAYFQVQDDYLDCFGDPELTGKVGTDIEDCKCSWLAVKALELANEEQKKLLHENYGKQDPACVEKVKELYKALDLEAVYEEYERESYENLINSIENHPSKAVKVVWGKYIASRGRVVKT